MSLSGIGLRSPEEVTLDKSWTAGIHTSAAVDETQNSSLQAESKKDVPRSNTRITYRVSDKEKYTI